LSNQSINQSVSESASQMSHEHAKQTRSSQALVFSGARASHRICGRSSRRRLGVPRELSPHSCAPE